MARVVVALMMSPTVEADEFTSGNHIVDTTIDGVFATGADTSVTIIEPAIVQSLPDDRFTSLQAEDGATVEVHGGEFTKRVGSATNAQVNIHGGVFRDFVSGGSDMNIHGGTFERSVIHGHGVLNIYGGEFDEVGYDSSSGATVNIYARSFRFYDDDAETIYYAYGFRELTEPGQVFSMTDGMCCLHGLVVMAEFANQTSDLRLFLDGPNTGWVNLIVVPEPDSWWLLAGYGVWLSTLGSRGRRGDCSS